MKTAGIPRPVLAGEFDYRNTHLAQQRPEIRMQSVDELRPEFDRYRRKSVVDRQKSAAHTVSRLENDRLQTPPAQLSAGGETGNPCSDDNGLCFRRIFHRPGF